MRKIMLHIVAATLTLGLAADARASEADLLREAQDRAEIQALMWRYVRALDTLDGEGYAAVFTEDGKFGSGRNSAAGRAALKKMIADIRRVRAEREAKGEPDSPPMFHVITNAYVEFVGKDRARHHSYWMTVFGAPDPNTPPRIAAAGRGLDELVRVSGEWLIESRDVAPQD